MDFDKELSRLHAARDQRQDELDREDSKHASRMDHRVIARLGSEIKQIEARIAELETARFDAELGRAPSGVDVLEAQVDRALKARLESLTVRKVIDEPSPAPMTTAAPDRDWAGMLRRKATPKPKASVYRH